MNLNQLVGSMITTQRQKIASAVTAAVLSLKNAGWGVKACEPGVIRHQIEADLNSLHAAVIEDNPAAFAVYMAGKGDLRRSPAGDSSNHRNHLLALTAVLRHTMVPGQMEVIDPYLEAGFQAIREREERLAAAALRKAPFWTAMLTFPGRLVHRQGSRAVDPAFRNRSRGS